MSEEWWQARRPVALLALLLLAVGIGACGGGQKMVANTPTVMSEFGQVADPTDRSQITTLVEHYYAAAANGEGGKACGLLFFALAEAAPEKYHWAPGPRWLNGANTCQAVLTRVFHHFHAVLRLRPTVTLVRVSGKRARALLHWSKLQAGYVEAVREGSFWKLNSLLAESA